MKNQLLLALALTVGAARAQAQSSAPTNDAPNPYRTVEGWARLPEGRTWGSTSAVDIDRNGTSIWVAERCGTNSCLASRLPSVLRFDASGRLERAFGEGLIASPHGIHVDHEGNVWVTDCACTRPAAGTVVDSATAPKGHQIFKFTSDGKLLMTLGAPGGGRDASYFWQPNDVHVAPNGDIFVAEGHSSAPATAVARVLKFDKTGTLLRTWGMFGKGDGQMDQPHALAMDSRGRLFVGDRGNDRILIYDQDGKLLDTWYQFSRPSGIHIDPADRIFVADSESGSVGSARESRKDFKRGIRIGSAKDGSVTAFIPDPDLNPPSTSAAEGVAVDKDGNVYGAEVGPKALKKYVRK